MKKSIKSILIATASVLAIPFLALAVQITVPSAPTSGYCLKSIANGTYAASVPNCGGGGGVTGGQAGMIPGYQDSTTLLPTSTPQVNSINATSTIATSTYSGNIMVTDSATEQFAPSGVFVTDSKPQIQISGSADDLTTQLTVRNRSATANAGSCITWENDIAPVGGINASSFMSGCLASSKFNSLFVPGLLNNDFVWYTPTGNVLYATASTTAKQIFCLGGSFSRANCDFFMVPQTTGKSFFGVGTSSPSSSLDVAGAILTEEGVQATSTSWTLNLSGINASSTSRIGVFAGTNETITFGSVISGIRNDYTICQSSGGVSTTTLAAPSGWNLKMGGYTATSLVASTTMLSGACDSMLVRTSMGTSSPLGSGTPFINVFITPLN